MSGMMIKGIYRDRLLDAEGRAVFDSGWRPNMIVLRCRELLAAFMRNDSDETKFGITSLKVGRGDPAWDAVPTANPNPNTTIKLVDGSPYSIDRSDPTRLTVQYLDANDQPVSGPTNRIEVIATLKHNEPTAATDPPYPLREFGLFGTFGTEEYMIDYIRHPLIEKDGSVILERRVRLIF